MIINFDSNLLSMFTEWSEVREQKILICKSLQNRCIVDVLVHGRRMPLRNIPFGSMRACRSKNQQQHEREKKNEKIFSFYFDRDAILSVLKKVRDEWLKSCAD